MAVAVTSAVVRVSDAPTVAVTGMSSASASRPVTDAVSARIAFSRRTLVEVEERGHDRLIDRFLARFLPTACTHIGIRRSRRRRSPGRPQTIEAASPVGFNLANTSRKSGRFKVTVFGRHRRDRRPVWLPDRHSGVCKRPASRTDQPTSQDSSATQCHIRNIRRD